jgi:hypothetical protein
MILHPRTKTLISYMDLSARQAGKSLPESDAGRISAHLNRCERCRKKYAMLQRIQEANSPKREIPEDFTQRVVGNLKDVTWSDQPICAEIKGVIGNATIHRNGSQEEVEAFPGMGLKKGDTLRVMGDSLALIELNDGSTLYVNKQTEIQFPRRDYPLALPIGEFFAMMKPQKKVFEIRTPSAVLGVIGTDFDAKVTKEKETILQVLKGKVSFKNQSGSTIVTKKRQVEAAINAKPVPQKIKQTQIIYNWTMPMNPRKKKYEGGWIMKKLYLVILAVAAIAVLAAGYFMYQEYVVYTPTSHYSTAKVSAPGERPSENAQKVSSESPKEVASVSPGTDARQNYDVLDLRPKWNVGKRYVFRIESISEGEARVPNRRDPVKTNSTLTEDLAISVLGERPGGGYEIQFEYVNMKMNVDAEDKKLTYDSSSGASVDPNNPLAPMIQATLGLKLKVFLDAEGKVDKVEGLESLQQYMDKTLAKTAPEIGNTLKGMFSEDSMKSMFKNFEPLTDKPIKVGETWTSTQELSLPFLGKTLLNNYYTFKEWDKRTDQRLAFVQFSGNMDSQSKKGADAGLMNISLENAFFTGKSWYNPEIGIAVETQIDQDMTFIIKTKVPVRGKTQEQAITSKMKNRVSVKLVDIGPVQP